MYCVSFFSIFYNLFITHLTIMLDQLGGKIANLYIWAICSLFVTGYVMQSFGLTSDFGNFQLATTIATVGFFEVYGNAVRNIMDFEGDQNIAYYLTLPTSPSVILLSIASAYACLGTLLSFIMLPAGKLILFNTFSLATISWIKFTIITIIANIFFALFTLAITGYVRSMSRIENVWSRFIFPLWYLGGFQFSWASMCALSLPFAYALLCNPVIYVMEGTRAALLGQQDCLSWWMCVGMLCLFSCVCWIYAYYKMKKLLDFV